MTTASLRLSFHLHTLYLFTKSDMKTLIPPVVRDAYILSLSPFFFFFLANTTLFTIPDSFRCGRRSVMQPLSPPPYCTLVVGPYATTWTRESDTPTRARRRCHEPSRPSPSCRSYHCPTSSHPTLDDDSFVSSTVRGLWSKDATHELWCIAFHAGLQ